jgi:hypothetical protein
VPFSMMGICDTRVDLNYQCRQISKSPIEQIVRVFCASLIYATK